MSQDYQRYQEFQQLQAKSFDSSKRVELIGDAIQSCIDSLIKRAEGKKSYLKSGLETLDQQLPGWLNEGHLIVVAGRPGMGKSAFGQMIAEHVSLTGNSSLLITLEMSSKEIAERSICRHTGISISSLKTKEISENQLGDISLTKEQYKKIPFLVTDSSFNIDEMCAFITKIANSVVEENKPPLRCVVIDYLQLVKADGANRYLEITKITHALKQVAKDLQISVIALSQLNRSLESRPDKRPQMSDLSESGSIEADADLILFLYRDECYTKESCTVPGIAEIICGKNRHGPTPTIRVGFNGNKVMFHDIEYQNENYKCEINKKSKGMKREYA